MLEEYLEIGFNYRMTDIQAAIGLVQLERLDEIVQRRGARHALPRLAGLGPGLELVDDPSWGRPELPVLLGRCSRAASRRSRRAAPGVARPRRLGPAGHHGLAPRARVAGPAHVPLPVTERIASDSLILPLFHEMTDAEQDRVVDGHRIEAEAPTTV